MRDDSKHRINYPRLFYTVANSDVTLSGREEGTWFTQAGVLFSLKKKGLGTTDRGLQATALLLSRETGEQISKQRLFLQEH